MFIKKVIDFKVKNKALAEDLYQDFFLALIRKPIPQHVTNIRGYLFCMLTKDILDATRRLLKYQKNIEKYANERPPLKQADSEQTGSVTASEHVEQMLQIAENHLSPREAQAVRLRFQENCCPLETASKMGIKPKTVNRYVSVGLDKIRQTFVVQEKG